MSHRTTLFAGLLMTLIAAIPVAARNVDLSTVPKRNTVQLTIYNSEDLTLVRETRSITFKKGLNPLQFSWANTLIDPTSVQLKFLNSPEKLDVLDTTFPHDKPQMLYWNVQSDLDGQATIEITYFTSGITWASDYICLADKEEKLLKLEGFVRVTNNSGEEYEDAQVRLVVGTINLVEKIAKLAHGSRLDPDKGEFEDRTTLRRDAAKAMLNDADQAERKGAKQIVKESLSEYFIYTIEGTETIPNGWSKRLRSFAADAVPFKIQYRYRPAEYGEQLVRMYLMTNDPTSKLGTTPLPDGVVRVFRDNGRDGLSYLTQQAIKYIPIGDKIELNLGPDPSVIFELIKLRAYRDNIWLQLRGLNVFKQVGLPNVQIDANATVAGWDDHELFTQRIRNYTTKPIDLEIRRSFEGHAIFHSPLDATLHDYHTVQFPAHIEAGKKADLQFEIVRHQGHNHKQDNVTLEKTAIER